MGAALGLNISWQGIITFYNTEKVKNSNADAMGRLPLKGWATEDETEGEVVLAIEQLDTSLMTARQVKAYTGKDPCLVVLREWIMSGWPQASEKTNYAIQDEFKAYWHRRDDLTVHDGCVVWGYRVVIPSKTKDVGGIARRPPRHIQKAKA